VYAAITRDSIDTTVLLSRVGAASDGAVLLFLGVVRDHNEGQAVTGVAYDAYTEMAERVLGDIALEAANRLGTDRVAVMHRTGRLAIGETSVAIAVSSPHRAESFDAARYIIEQIKLRLPVWKRELYASGSSDWLDGSTPAVERTHG
jgi:molybdopterin synthase catalytic subunit